MFDIIDLGEHNEDHYYFVKINSDNRSKAGFFAYISLCDKYVAFTFDGEPVKYGSVTRNSCCLRCDAHEMSGYNEKAENWTSLKCIDISETFTYTLEKYLSEQSIYPNPIPDKHIQGHEICPRCYELLQETGQQLKEDNVGTITANLI